LNAGPDAERSAFARWMRPFDRWRAALEAFFRKQFRANSLATWFLRALRAQERRRRRGHDVNYYEFGIGPGRTMMRYIKALKLHCRLTGVDPYSYRIFGFDSFEGLPPKRSWRDDLAGWREGQFRITQEQTAARIGAELELARGSVRLIKGFFEDALTAELARELSPYPPSIVTIDVDYYTSTRTVLDWLLPMAPSGCLFYFDDIWAFYGHPEMGELAAIAEVNAGGLGYLLPYTELESTVGGRTYVFVRKNFEFRSAGGLPL
jgi:hypothetical protein